MVQYEYTWGYWGDLEFKNEPMISKSGSQHANYIHRVFGSRGLPAIAGISVREIKTGEKL